MKFSISREALQKALRVVSGVVERRQHQNPVLSNVYLSVEDEQLQVVATDQEVELTATAVVNQVIMPGRALVPCRKLNDICRVLPDGMDIIIDSSVEKTLIRAGQSRFVLSALPTEQFPKTGSFAEQQSIRVSRQDFMRLIEKTAFAMADEDVRYFLNGMLFEVGENFLRMVAADGHRLAMQTMPFQGDAVDAAKVIIPRKGVLEILRVLGESMAETAAIAFSGSHLRVVCDDLSLTTVLLVGKYPDYERVIPRRGDKVVCGQREILKEAIHRASALLNEKFKGIRLKFVNGGMKIFAHNTEKDEAEEDLAVDFSGGEIELGFNARYLLDFLSSVSAETIKMTFSDPNGSALLEELGDSCSGVCVIMPMRI